MPPQVARDAVMYSVPRLSQRLQLDQVAAAQKVAEAAAEPDGGAASDGVSEGKGGGLGRGGWWVCGPRRTGHGAAGCCGAGQGEGGQGGAAYHACMSDTPAKGTGQPHD